MYKVVISLLSLLGTRPLWVFRLDEALSWGLLDSSVVFSPALCMVRWTPSGPCQVRSGARP